MAATKQITMQAQFLRWHGQREAGENEFCVMAEITTGPAPLIGRQVVLQLTREDALKMLDGLKRGLASAKRQEDRP